MAISSITLAALVGLATQQSGTFTTDAAGDLTKTTTANIGVNSSTMTLSDTTGFESSAELVTIPGGGLSGVDVILPILLRASTTVLNIPNPGISTQVNSGAIITRWNRISITARPKHVRITQQDTGDYYDWVDGMEPYSANASIASVTSVVAKAMLCQSGAIHVGPGILVASKTYSILVEY